MPSTARPRLLLVLALLALLAPLLVLVSPGGADAAPRRGTVRGEIIAAGGVLGRAEVRWFSHDWRYLGRKQVRNGTYSLSLPAGRYRIQVVDLRPQYDVRKFAPTDVTVHVRAGRTVQRSVRMQRGGVITGRVTAGGRPAAGARVVAANVYEQSYEVKANARGQFAIGGLPPTSYSVFTYDARRTWAAPSTFVRRLKAGQARDLRIRLDRRAGRMLVDIYDLDGRKVPTTWVTAVQRTTGQFYVVKAKRGTASFAGLMPGRYRLSVPAVGGYLEQSGPVGRVRPNRTRFADFRMTRRGGWFTGRVITGDDAADPVREAAVRLYDSSGGLLASAVTDSRGRFHLGGQLRTGTGLTVVVFHQYSDAYQRVELPGLRIRTGQGLDLGTIELPRVSGRQAAPPTRTTPPTRPTRPTQPAAASTRMSPSPQ